MADTFPLEVITPQAKVFAGDVETVLAPGFYGDFGVLPEHEPYITAVRAGVLRFDHGGQHHFYVVGAGFAEVSPEKVILLVDLCEDASIADAEKAAEVMKADERAMLDNDPDQAEYLDAEADLDLQIARIRASEEVSHTD